MIIPLDGLLNISFGFSQIWNFLFLANLFNCAFSLSVCVFIAVTMNGLKLDMLIYPDHLHNLLDFGHRLLIFLILAPFYLVGKLRFGVSWIFFGTQGKNGLKFDMLLLTWPPLELITFWSQSVDFPHFGGIWTSVTDQICSFQAFYWECIGGMGWNLPCWCIRATLRTDLILVMVCWFSSFFFPLCPLCCSVSIWLAFDS